jgi:hypothetical protein
LRAKNEVFHREVYPMFSTGRRHQFRSVLHLWAQLISAVRKFDRFGTPQGYG